MKSFESLTFLEEYSRFHAKDEDWALRASPSPSDETVHRRHHQILPLPAEDRRSAPMNWLVSL